jgi:hypothetical protein
MRKHALAAAAAALAIFVGLAEAREYRHASGNLVFDAPADWPVTNEPASEGLVYVIAGDNDNECHIMAQTNANTRGAPSYDTWRTARSDERFDQAFWLDKANVFSRVFPQRSATFVSRSRDDAGFWPLQRAELDSPTRGRVYAGLQLRPGVDIYAICVNYEGAAPTATFDSVLRSLGHPGDAEMRAAAETRIAERAAQEAAAAQAQQQQQQQQQQAPEEGQRRRRN